MQKNASYKMGDKMNLEELQPFELFLLLELKRIISENEMIASFWEEEKIYKLVKKYYQEQIGKVLDETILDNRDILYEWLKENTRYQLLNELMKLTINRLIKKESKEEAPGEDIDYFISNNLKVLIEVMLEQLKNSMFAIETTQVTETSLSKENYEKLIEEFLIEVDPSLEWLMIYQEMKKNHRIFNLENRNESKRLELSEQLKIENLDYGYQALLISGNPYLITENRGVLKDFVSTIHEFSHYVTFYKKNYINKRLSQVISEYPSIFYEMYALSFLKRKGYKEEELISIRNFRNQDTMSTTSYNHVVFRYIEMFLDHHEVKEELDVQDKNKTVLVMKELPEEVQRIVLNNLPNILDAKKSAHEACDDCIEFLLKYPSQFFNSYSYSLGNYLALHSLEMVTKDKSHLEKVKYFTEHLYEIDPYQVFQESGCDVEKIGLVKTNAKIKQRKL